MGTPFRKYDGFPRESHFEESPKHAQIYDKIILPFLSYMGLTAMTFFHALVRVIPLGELNRQE